MVSLRDNRTATVAGHAPAIRWVPLAWAVLMLWAHAAVAQEGEANAPQPSNARPAPGEQMREALAKDPEAFFREMSNGQERVGKEDFQRHLLAKFEQLKDRPGLRAGCSIDWTLIGMGSDAERVSGDHESGTAGQAAGGTQGRATARGCRCRVRFAPRARAAGGFVQILERTARRPARPSAGLRRRGA